MSRKALFIVIALAFLGSACAVSSQQKGIRDARIGIASGGVALEAATDAATEYFEEFPAEETEKYCQGEVTLWILKAVRTALVAAADTVTLWETSLVVYMAKRDAGQETGVDWSAVLSSEAAWFKVAVDVIAVVDAVRQYLKQVGVKLPTVVDYAWGFLYGMTGKPTVPEPDIVWKDLKNGVCAPYLPGGE